MMKLNKLGNDGMTWAQFKSAGGRANDAMGGSGLAFLASSLELLDPDVTEPLQSVTHGRDLDVEIGGGFPQFISGYASNYATTGTAQYGLQGTNNTDVPMVQADLQKGTWNTYIWETGYYISQVDLERLNTAKALGQPPPISLQDLLDAGSKSFYVKDLDRLAYLGWQGQPGLLNNPVVPVTDAAGSANQTQWAWKLSAANTANNGPQLILNDINTALTTTIQNSGFNVQDGIANRCLVGFSQYQLLTAPMTIGGVGGFESILKYVERNSVAANSGVDFKILPLPDPWLTGLSTVSSSSRALFYRKDRNAVRFKLPTPMQHAMTVPTTRYGAGYETIMNACLAQVIFRRQSTMTYLDGI